MKEVTKSILGVLAVVGFAAISINAKYNGTMDAINTLIILAVLLAIYFLPWIVAINRRHIERSAIGILNLTCGWTFVGWIAALVWAMTSKVEPPRIQIIPPNRSRT